MTIAPFNIGDKVRVPADAIYLTIGCERLGWKFPEYGYVVDNRIFDGLDRREIKLYSIPPVPSGVPHPWFLSREYDQYQQPKIRAYVDPDKIELVERGPIVATESEWWALVKTIN